MQQMVKKFEINNITTEQDIDSFLKDGWFIKYAETIVPTIGSCKHVLVIFEKGK